MIIVVSVLKLDVAVEAVSAVADELKPSRPNYLEDGILTHVGGDIEAEHADDERVGGRVDEARSVGDDKSIGIHSNGKL